MFPSSMHDQKLGQITLFLTSFLYDCGLLLSSDHINDDNVFYIVVFSSESSESSSFLFFIVFSFFVLNFLPRCIVEENDKVDKEFLFMVNMKRNSQAYVCVAVFWFCFLMK